MPQNAGTSLADAGRWRVYLLCSWWLTIEWIVVYGGSNWITGLHDYRVDLHTALDSQIPFVPATAIIYLSLFPMLWLSALVLHTPQQIQSFARAIGVLIAISGLGFLFVPAQQLYEGPAGPSTTGLAFQLADWINLNYNSLPSLHVGMAVACAYFYSRLTSLTVAVGWWAWATAIALSTLLTHQHYVVDVATGGALGFIVAASAKSRRIDVGVSHQD